MTIIYIFKSYYLYFEHFNPLLII